MKKKSVKKLLSAVLVSAMTVVLLAGCGGSGDSGSDEGGSGDGKTLKVAAFEGGNGAEIWEKITAAFEEEYDCEVELELSSELDQVLTKEIQNGDVPDVVYYNLGQESGFTETMLKEKAVADISDVFDDELRFQVIRASVERNLRISPALTYITTNGPRLESKAEIRAYRSWGADVVGMTLNPEVNLIHELGIKLCSICFSINWAAGLDEEGISFIEGESRKKLTSRVLDIAIDALKNS